jgi:hypothetical protein
MNHPKRLTFALAALLGSLASLRSATPVNRLVEANAVFFVTLDDPGTLHKNWANSPFGRTWNDPQMVKFLAPIREVIKIDEWDERCRSETGKGIDELVSGFGSMLFAVQDLSAAIADETGKTPPAMLLALELRANRDVVLKMIEKDREKTRRTELTEEFQGESLHIETADAGKAGAQAVCWVIAGDVLLLSTDKHTVQQAVADYKRGGAESPYIETDQFKAEVKRLPDAQIRVHLDVEHLMPLVMAMIARTPAAKNPTTPGVNAETIVKALGLDALRTVSIDTRIGEQDSLMAFGVTYGLLHGLTRVFSCYGDGPPPEPTFLSGNWTSVSAARFRLAELYAVIEETVHGMGPDIDAKFQDGVGNLNKRTGIDLKRDLFGKIGDEIYTAARFDDAGTGGAAPASRQLMVFSVRDPKAFEATLETLKTGLLGPAAPQMFRSHEYLGTKIQSMVNPRTPGAAQNPGPYGAPGSVANPVFSFAVTERYLVLGIGGEDLVETAIHNMQSPQPSFWSRPEVKTALARLPDGAISYSYLNMSKLVPVYLNLFTQAMQMGQVRVKDGRLTIAPAVPRTRPKAGGPGNGPADEPVMPKPPEDTGKFPLDLSQKPADDDIARYWGPVVTANYRDATGFYGVARMDHSQ